MNSLIVSIVILVWLALAYVFYGRFISRILVKPDNAKATPAHTLQDGVDYSPSKRRFLWGNHFASIAGAGPIIGPIVAISFFGWGPTLLWVAIGAVFLGAVHDYLALMMSVRHKGRGISELAAQTVGKPAAAMFAIMLYFVLVLLIAVFMVSVANALISMPALVIPTFGLIGVAILLGYALERWRVPELIASPLAVLLAYYLIWVGYHLPISLPEFLGKDGVMAVWLVVLAAYCLMASVAPMWMLLKPRDFISGIKLAVGMLLGFAAIFVVQPVINAPFDQGAFIDHGKPLWPILFILVACGAISGFHAIVSTGTTARQLDRETDGRGIAYGGMLMEGALAVLVIMVVSAGMKWGAAPDGLTGHAANAYFATALKKGWIIAFGSGFGNVVSGLEIPYLTAGIAALLGAVMVKSFILTTLDAGTRLARFLINESVGKKVPLLNGLWVASFVVLVPAFLLALTNSYSEVWKLFGAANQLIAAVTLLTLTVWLASQNLPRRYTLIPAGFMLLTTTAALLWEMFNTRDGYFLGAQPDYYLGGIAAVLIILEAVVLFGGYKALMAARAPELEEEPQGMLVERAHHRMGLYSMSRCKGLMLACFLAATFVYAGPAAGFSESENASFLENSFLTVLQSEYGISGTSLLSHETLDAITALPAFQAWRSRLLADQDAASAMASTAMGEIQYRREGTGPIMLIFHGGMTGFDGNYLLEGLVEEGFQLIGFSRPGYLRTPLGQSPSFAEEADMAAALLDYLGVSEPVVVYGTSLGGPSALYFALNHPQRTRAVLMQSAVSQTYAPSDAAAGSFLGRFFFGDYALDERSWILLEMAKRWPERLFFEYLYITNHYCDDQNWVNAQTCMADPVQRERFILLLTIMSPLSLRMPGTFSEDEYAAVLPDLPLGNIKVPALITQDLMDADVEFRHAQYMINTIPNAQLYSFRGMGHFYMFGGTWPGTFNRVVEFLKSVSPR